MIVKFVLKLELPLLAPVLTKNHYVEFNIVGKQAKKQYSETDVRDVIHMKRS